MTHVSRRSGDWDKVKTYLRLFGEIFLEMQNSGLKQAWFESETTYLQTIYSARGFRRAAPVDVRERGDSFPYLDIVLEISLGDCATMIAGEKDTPQRSEWERALLALMLYNQDILLTFKACFLEVARSQRGESGVEQCRKRLEILRTRWADSENSGILGRIKVLDSAFMETRFAPFIILLAPGTHCFNTGLDPVAQDLRCLGKLDDLPVVSPEVRETTAYFKSTCGGFRRLFWIRYLRNLTLLYILEIFALGASEIEGVEAATKLCIILTDSLAQFPAGYNHLPEMAQHGFSLAELVFRISPMTTGTEGKLPLVGVGVMVVAWVQSLGVMTGVNSRVGAEDMPDWNLIFDIPGICDALLTRSHYWES